MAQKIMVSGHLLEMFMPYLYDEKRMIEVLEKATALGFYKGVEMPIFFDKKNRQTIRSLIESNGLNGTTFITPYTKFQHLSLADLDEAARQKTVQLVKQLADFAAESGYTNFGISNGDDPGAPLRGFAKVAQAESVYEIADYIKQYGMNLTLEPLDRYAYKKQLIGPMEETVTWFEPIHEQCPNAYIHWDSAHEALGGIDLMKSIDLAAPYIAQFHLCDAICDPNHPCFGDLHMDVAVAPDWQTEGYLTPELGAEILKRIASHDKPVGVENVYVSVEITGHPGQHLWEVEEHSRMFLQRCFDLAGMDY